VSHLGQRGLIFRRGCRRRVAFVRASCVDTRGYEGVEMIAGRTATRGNHHPRILSITMGEMIMKHRINLWISNDQFDGFGGRR